MFRRTDVACFFSAVPCAQPWEIQHGRVSESQDIDEVANICFLKRELAHSCTGYRALLTRLECSRLAGFREDKENTDGPSR